MKYVALAGRWLAWIFAVVAVISLCSYLIDADYRISKTEECKWNPVENPNDLPYTARFCYLDTKTVLLRLYDLAGEELLAERYYWCTDLARIYWYEKGLGYDTSTGDAISIPPTLLDRIRARLP